ncbi:MAG: hypothetical protein IPK78_03200 [Rhodospirillales bacterium]|nr:hypothetical protein [Rhodospirillales bacterium]
MPKRLVRVLELVPAALLAGCASLSGENPTATQSVGNNLVGEPCRTAPARTGTDLGEGATAFELYCGRWEQPSAQMVRVSGKADDLRVLSTQGAWRDQLDTVAECDAPTETTLLDGQPALAFDCSLRNGGWPYQAVAVAVGPDVYLGDGIPAAQPPLVRGIGVISGRQSGDQPTPSTEGSIPRNGGIRSKSREPPVQSWRSAGLQRHTPARPVPQRTRQLR